MSHKDETQKTVDLLLRLGLLFALLYWCFLLIFPFIMPFLWGIIIAVAINPAHKWLSEKLNLGRTKASILLVLLMVVGVIFPAYEFFASVAHLISMVKTEIESGSFNQQEFQTEMHALPLIGDKVDAILVEVNTNFKGFIIEHKDTILQLFQRMAAIALNTGISLVMVIVAMIISGVLLAYEDLGNWSRKLFKRTIGENGPTYADLSANTIRTVVKGVLGVAVIQAILVGIGLTFSGIPHAPLWTIIALILAIIQVGPFVILLGAIIYLFNTESATFAGIWTGYFLLVGLSDNILKPILLGKGAQVPTLVIFIGVIGGFMMSGFIGLFTGAIILSIAYKLAEKWMQDEKEEASLPQDNY